MKLDTVIREFERIFVAASRGDRIAIDPELFDDAIWFLRAFRRNAGIDVERPAKRERRERNYESPFQESPYTEGMTAAKMEEIIRNFEQQFRRERSDRSSYEQMWQGTFDHRYWQQQQSRQRGSDFWGSTNNARTEPPKDPKVRPWHEVLGVRPDATKPQRQKAYRSLAQRLHPDKQGGSTKAFQELQQAKREAGL